MSATTRPWQDALDDARQDGVPHVICMFQPAHPAEPIEAHQTLNEVFGPFPDELAALQFIGEHDLGGDGDDHRFVYVVAPLESPATLAGAMANR
jgi:hypothetical protein